MLSWFFKSPKARLNRTRRLLVACQKRKWWGLAKILIHRIQNRHGIFLPLKEMVPLSTEFLHPTSIVIGDGVRLGERIKIYQGVTLGGARRGDWQAGNYPVIGDDVVLFAGAVVIGAVRVGNKCTIGANSVVLNDVPDGHTAVGVPARILPPKS